MARLNLKHALYVAVLAIVVYLVMLTLSDWKQIVAITVSPFVIGIFLLLTLANYLLRSLKWHFFLKRMNVEIGYRENLLVFLSGLSMIVTPIKVGEVIKCYTIRTFAKAHFGKVLPAVVVERLTDMVALCILALSGLLLSSSIAYLAALAIVLMLIVIALVKNKRAYDVFARIPLLSRFLNEIETAHKSGRKLTSAGSIGVALGITVPSWLMEGLGMWILLGAVGYRTNILVPVFIFSFSSVFGTLTMLPGGLGAAEVSSTMLLMQFLNMNLTTAVWVTIVTRLCTIWFGTAVGIVSLLLIERLKRQKQLVV